MKSYESIKSDYDRLWAKEHASGTTNIKSNFRLVVMEAAMAYIERAITSVIEKRVSSSKCMMLTGARQVGKSTLIKHVFPAYHRANKHS